MGLPVAKRLGKAAFRAYAEVWPSTRTCIRCDANPEREPERKPQPEPQSPEPRPQEPLWREVLGRRLRLLRQEQQETLSETATRAGISPQYLSEVERGRKEPSSEMIAALAGALGTTLIDLTEQVAGDLRRQRPSRRARAAPASGRTGPGDILALAA